ncbi:putative addiction module killer protein (plasmid) [Piscirickettsia salmonis]|uniref:type II toxin-antitoxin system RelE/ParE family toxin n=1 Tax=Piscirickettsia salmonis TaxID=1238 RepID=UPI0012BACC33|nr:type II toxin-antitoxin system RelE/ParE family toxin [Piscirickettsia salmonis]QGP56996.1 putative addiction module killer protein [Piscirickettsia salmonis]QGP61762.1 putative addiction module killer protein [Piscirickettsia salmonis]QGP66600.1 putative addiction module killer protein [Piscirickettsia salmonis]
MSIEIEEYLNERGESAYFKWITKLNAVAQVKIVTAVRRIAKGNSSNMKHIGAGVWELTIDFGPGYRVYCGKDGPILIILLNGGSKKRQQNDIDKAKSYWKDYKKRK